MTLEELKQASVATLKTANVIKNECAAAIREAQAKATKEVYALYDERTKAAWAVHAEALRAYQAALVISSHERLKTMHQGILVEWGSRKLDRWSRSNEKVPLRRARLEVREPQTPMPGNAASYRTPDIGDIYLRILKKDGSPGLNVERYDQGQFGNARYWLPEGEAPSSARTEAENRE